MLDAAGDIHYTPGQIVRELDRHIVGQDDAKRAVAIALRNRWRRQQAPEELRDEIIPNNIIMIGPTGVGKTEIARRLARLVAAPFVKVEATNYTEVGYVGRDVESMIRDLVEIGVSMVTAEHRERVREAARDRVEERLLDLLMPAPTRTPDAASEEDAAERRLRTRQKLREKLAAGHLEERVVTVPVTTSRPNPVIEIFTRGGLEDMNLNMPGLGGPGGPFAGRQRRDREVPIREARELLLDEEIEKLVDMEKVVEDAKRRAETGGIVFIDEIDKIAARTAATSGPDVSREGVQRDLLPVVEGTAVKTRYGVVRTDHILFIAAGAFNVSKPSDLIPEFQGRFPIRVELGALGQADFERILREPHSSLVKQYAALFASDGCELSFEDGAIAEVARVAHVANERSENIGARRLQTVLATLLEDLLFELPESGRRRVVVTAEDVRGKLDGILASEDLTRYIL